MVLLTPLIALVALHGQQGDGSLFAKFVPNPTGKNGYEDYLRAGDLAGPDLWPKYEVWLSYKSNVGRNLIDPQDTSAMPPIPPGVEVDMSDLAVRKAANDRLGSAYEVIHQGNLKPMIDPRRQPAFETDYPELARFKMLSKIGINKAYVEFSDGRTTQAVTDLLGGLKFSKSLFGSTLISSLVSIAMQAIFLAEFQLHLGQLSLSEAQLVDKTCRSLIGVPYPVADVFQHELEMTVNSLDRVIDKPSLVLSEDQQALYGSALQGLNASDRNQLKQFVTQALTSRYAQLEDRLSGPEPGWVRGNEGDDPKSSPEDKSVSNLALVLANGLQGKSLQRQITQAMAKGKVQLMLLRLHAKVIEYHWQNRIWPAKIEEFADDKSAIDPFSREPFHYELKEGSYRLYSTGIPGLGPLELKYRPLPSRPNSGSEHPEPS